jgi:DnaK suppressor protein
MRHDIAQLEKKLNEERNMLLSELASVGRVNPENNNDWEPTANTEGADMAEEEERATEIADFRDRAATEFELESRYRRVERALERIASDTYGICLICGGDIESQRLSAEPSAETCIAHKDQAEPERPLL